MLSHESTYTFIVNDDTYFDGPLIDPLAADFDRLPDNAAVVSPKLVFPDGRIQLCVRISAMTTQAFRR